MVVVAHELGEQREQMPLIRHDDVVKTLLAKGPHYPFRDRVRQRRPEGVRMSAMPMPATLVPKSSP